MAPGDGQETPARDHDNVESSVSVRVAAPGHAGRGARTNHEAN